MAGRGGRGGGRGRGMSFSVDVLGFGRGDALPPPMLQPPTLFPPLDSKPVPLVVGEEQDYLLALKQEFRGTLRDSKFFTTALEKKKDVVRYSDRYQQATLNSGTSEYAWSRFPKELKPLVKRRKLTTSSKVKPNVKAAIDSKRIQDVTKKLEDLEAKEKSGGSGGEEGEEEEETEEKQANQDDEDLEEVLDEEDLEEGTDYALSYFENGENYLDEEEDNLDDGPTY